MKHMKLFENFDPFQEEDWDEEDLSEKYPEVDYDSLEFDRNKEFFRRSIMTGRPIVFSTDEGEKDIEDMLDTATITYDVFKNMEGLKDSRGLTIDHDYIKKFLDRKRMYEERLKVYLEVENFIRRIK